MVFPAPGVATARKSTAADAFKNVERPPLPRPQSNRSRHSAISRVATGAKLISAAAAVTGYAVHLMVQGSRQGVVSFANSKYGADRHATVVHGAEIGAYASGTERSTRLGLMCALQGRLMRVVGPNDYRSHQLSPVALGVGAAICPDLFVC